MNKKFSWKAFISFGLAYMMIFLIVSGIILYVSPPGRYAHWVTWKLWGMTKEEWQAIHTIFSFAFIVLSVFHLFSANWKVFVSYIRSKKVGGFNKKFELLFATLFIVVFFFGTFFTIPPFENVITLGENLTNSWEGEEDRAPIAHAELLTLDELSFQMKIDSVGILTQKLDNHQIKYQNTQTQTLQEIADDNQTTPAELYEIVSKKAGNAMQGSGVGRKTIEDFSIEINKTTDEILSILSANNIKARSGQTLKTIGEENNISPRDVYNLISK